MTYQEAIKILKNLYPKTAKMVDGRYKGGFDDIESESGQALNMAIEALEKQIPKQPIGEKYELIEGCGKCPNCNNFIDDMRSYRVCGRCGQAIDWSETE